MFIVYVLRSERDLSFYIGLTGDLVKRIKKHDAGGDVDEVPTSAEVGLPGNI